MKKRNEKLREFIFLALCSAAAIVLSYVESLFPVLISIAPGIKLGFANVVVIFVLYRFGFIKAAAVSFLRLAVVTLLFGNLVMLVYSAAGAILSLLVMMLLKKLNWFSSVGVSVAGGVFHNLGQILMAMLLLETPKLGYYMIVLTITGTIAGIFVGLCAGYIIQRFAAYPSWGGKTK